MAKLIRISDSTYKMLGEYGHWLDTMDSIIGRLLYEAKMVQERDLKTGRILNEVKQ